MSTSPAAGIFTILLFTWEVAVCVAGTVVYQLTCPCCSNWLVEWKPSPGGIVRARCDKPGCKHHVRFTYDNAGCLITTILPRDMFSRLRKMFLWLPLPISGLIHEQILTQDGKRFRLTIQPLD